MSKGDTSTRILSLEIAISRFMTIHSLKQLAAHTGRTIPKRKTELADLVVRHLEGDRLEAVWRGLDDLQQAAVAEVTHSTSTAFSPQSFIAAHGQEPSWKTDETAYGFSARPSALNFFFFGYDRVMPDDIQTRLRDVIPKPNPRGVKLTPELPSAYDLSHERWILEPSAESDEDSDVSPLMVHLGECRAERELRALLRLVDAGQVKVSAKTQRPSAATVRAVAGVLEGHDYYPALPVKSKWRDENTGPIRAFAWPLLIQVGGLAKLVGAKLQLTSTGRKALSGPLAKTTHRLWSKWLNTRIIDELSRVEHIKGQTSKRGRNVTAVAPRRQAVSDALARCPVDVWISADDFLRYMRTSRDDFGAVNDPWALYLHNPQYGSLGYGNGQQIVDARYVFALLLEYAATLGLIDVALLAPVGARQDYRALWGGDDLLFLSRYDGLMYLKLTPLGAYCVGASDTYSPPPVQVSSVFKVLPNLEIVPTLAALEPGDQMALDTYAVQISSQRWRLDPMKLLQAVDEGSSIEEMRTFLTTRCDGDLPETVSRLFKDVSARSTVVKDRGLARLIECKDPALADMIARSTETQKHCIRAGTRQLVVPASSERAFRRALLEMGYTIAAGATKRAN